MNLKKSPLSSDIRIHKFSLTEIKSRQLQPRWDCFQVMWLWYRKERAEEQWLWGMRVLGKRLIISTHNESLVDRMFEGVVSMTVLSKSLTYWSAGLSLIWIYLSLYLTSILLAWCLIHECVILKLCCSSDFSVFLGTLDPGVSEWWNILCFINITT